MKILKTIFKVSRLAKDIGIKPPKFQPFKRVAGVVTGKRILYAQAIDTYTNASANLRGCVNDLQLVEVNAMAQGYAVKWLKNEQATRGNILSNLRRAVVDAKAGCRVRYWLSGHGTRLADRGGDEIDHLDGAIVSHDMKAVLDDEVYEILRVLDNSHDFGLILDICHSGEFPRFYIDIKGLTDGVPGVVVRTVAPALVDFAEAQSAMLNVVRLFERGINDVSVLTASTEKQVSMESSVNGKHYGAFTFHAFKTYQPGMTFENVRNRAADSLKRAGFQQTPMVKGKIERPLL